MEENISRHTARRILLNVWFDDCSTCQMTHSDVKVGTDREVIQTNVLHLN